MKFHCIADEDTVRGFRFAGVEGDVVSSDSEAAVAVQKAVAKNDCAILILTEAVANGIRSLVDSVRFERERPLIVEIPDRPEGLRKNLTQLVQEAIGIRIDSEKEL